MGYRKWTSTISTETLDVSHESPDVPHHALTDPPSPTSSYSAYHSDAVSSAFEASASSWAGPISAVRHSPHGMSSMDPFPSLGKYTKRVSTSPSCVSNASTQTDDFVGVVASLVQLGLQEQQRTQMVLRRTNQLSMDDDRRHRGLPTMV